MGAKNTKSNNITIISYNCDLFCYNYIRYNELIKFIKNVKDDYIICLQGIKDDKTYNLLQDELVSIQSYNKIIPSVYNNNNLELIKNNGLCIISSFKIINYEFDKINFESCINNLFNNGYIKCIINVNNYNLCIYNINIENSNNNIVNTNKAINDRLLLLIDEIASTYKSNYIYYITGNFNLSIQNKNIESIELFNIFEKYKKNITNFDMYKNIYLLIDKRLFNILDFDKHILSNDIKIRIRTDICISSYFPIEINIKNSLFKK